MVCTAVESFYHDPVPIDDMPEAFGALVRFSEGGADDSTGVSNDSSPADALSMDYHCDAPYIAAAFQQAYGIDLTCEKVHWWRFRALLRGLPEDTRYASILTVRSKDTSRMEGDELVYWEALKDLYALPDALQGGGGRPETLQDHEDAFLARF